MEYQRNSLLSLAYFYQGRGVEELRQSLVYTTLELEQTKLAAQEELRKKDDQLSHFRDLINKTIKERDDAQDKYQRLLLEKLLLQQQQQNAPLSGVSGIEDDPRKGNDSNNGFSLSDCEESIVSSPVIDPVPHPLLHPELPTPQIAVELVPDKPLPEKGKLLQAVMKAGPLLQTLLLAGPLPQWRHPPPPLKSVEIPPVSIPSSPTPQPVLLKDSLINMSNCSSPTATCARMNRKRVSCDGSDSPIGTKYQRTALL